jgi:hypothetical protein
MTIYHSDADETQENNRAVNEKEPPGDSQGGSDYSAGLLYFYFAIW